jgi:hypothetical protein
MTHLSILKISYGQKKGRESNCQFDFQPLKVGNRLDLLTCRWRATYHWKALNKGYNFSLDLTSIIGLHTKLCTPKVVEVPIQGILGLQLGSPRTKWHLSVGHVPMHKKYYKGEGGGLGRGESCESMFGHGLSAHQKCSNYAVTNLLFSLCRFVGIIDPFVIPPNPHLEALACPSSPKVLRAKEHAPTPCFSVGFSLDSHLNPLRSLGARQIDWKKLQLGYH